MSNRTHRLELADDGYEKIEAKLQKIENLANGGIFSETSRTSRFHTIWSEVKKLRQLLTEVLLIVPNNVSENSKGDAA